MNVYASISLRAVVPPCPTSPSFSSSSESLGQVNFLCFHCPSYQFLFCPSSGCSWYSLMCRGNAAPGGIPPPPTLVPNFTLTNWPRVPLPLTSFCFPWQHGPVHEPAGPVHLVYNAAQRAAGWTDTWLWNFVQKAASMRTEQAREEERESETACGRSVGDFGWK